MFEYSIIMNRRIFLGRVFFYDYGTEERNMLEYGSPTPPEVNFGKIKVPVYFVYGPNDLFTSVEVCQIIK